MTDETTTSERLAEIEEQAADIPASEYTPPDGWRVLAAGETISPGDQWVRPDDGRVFASIRSSGIVLKGTRYLRRIEQEPQPQPETEPQAQSQSQPVSDADQQIKLLEQANHNLAGTIGRLQARSNELEKLVSSLRTINDAQEKAVEAAGKENTALRLQVENRQQEYERQKGRIEFLETLNAGNGAAIGDYIAKVAKLQSLVDTARQQLEVAATEHDSLSTQLAAVKAELVTQAETSRRLQIELDAAQQVPQAVNDRFEEGWDAGTARAVETIAEWTEPFRTCGSQGLSYHVVQNLPHIMRTLTGLTPED